MKNDKKIVNSSSPPPFWMKDLPKFWKLGFFNFNKSRWFFLWFYGNHRKIFDYYSRYLLIAKIRIRLAVPKLREFVVFETSAWFFRFLTSRPRKHTCSDTSINLLRIPKFDLKSCNCSDANNSTCIKIRCKIFIKFVYVDKLMTPPPPYVDKRRHLVNPPSPSPFYIICVWPGEGCSNVSKEHSNCVPIYIFGANWSRTYSRGYCCWRDCRHESRLAK